MNKVFLVYANVDHNEGKGPSALQHVFGEKQIARNWMEAQPDPWNRPNRDWDEETNTRFGHMHYVEHDVITEDISGLEEHRNAVVQEVFAGLTDDQRRAFEAKGLTLEVLLRGEAKVLSSHPDDSLSEMFSARVAKRLRFGGMNTLRDLLLRCEDDLLDINNFGSLALAEVKNVLKARDLNLSKQHYAGGS